MDIEILISQYIDGELSSESEAELHHTMAVSPEARALFRQQIALRGVARDVRVLHTPAPALKNTLFARLQAEGFQPPPPLPAVEFANDRSSVASNTLRGDFRRAPGRRRRMVAALLPFALGIVVTGLLLNVYDGYVKKSPSTTGITSPATLADNGVRMPDGPVAVATRPNEVTVGNTMTAPAESPHHHSTHALPGMGTTSSGKAYSEGLVREESLAKSVAAQNLPRENAESYNDELPRADTGFNATQRNSADNGPMTPVTALKPAGMADDAKAVSMAPPAPLALGTMAPADRDMPVSPRVPLTARRGRASGTVPVNGGGGIGGNDREAADIMSDNRQMIPPPNIPQFPRGEKPSASYFQQNVVITRDTMSAPALSAQLPSDYPNLDGLIVFNYQGSGSTKASTVKITRSGNSDTITSLRIGNQESQPLDPVSANRFAWVLGTGGGMTYGTANKASFGEISIKAGGEWRSGHQVYLIVGRSGFRQNEALTTTTRDAGNNVTSMVTTSSVNNGYEFWGGTGYRYSVVLGRNMLVGGGVFGGLGRRYVRAGAEVPISYQMSRSVRICVAPTVTYTNAVDRTAKGAVVSETKDQVTGTTLKQESSTTVSDNDEVRAGANIGVEVTIP